MAINLLSDEQFTVTDAELIDGGDKETTYTLRRCPPDVAEKFQQKHTKPSNYRRPERFNAERYREDMLDYAIVDWTGILDRGEPVPCERSYKLRLSNPRKIAILERAGMEEVIAKREAEQEAADQKAESFRAPADVG